MYIVKVFVVRFWFFCCYLLFVLPSPDMAIFDENCLSRASQSHKQAGAKVFVCKYRCKISFNNIHKYFVFFHNEFILCEKLNNFFICFIVCVSVCRSVRLPDWLVGWMVSWLVSLLVDCWLPRTGVSKGVHRWNIYS